MKPGSDELYCIPERRSWIHMKKKITLLLMFIIFVCGFSSRDTTLYYAATHFPPWDINLEEKEARGVNADIIRHIAKELGLTFEPVKCPWKRCLQLLEEGKIDMAGTVGRTPERERFLHFVEPTYAPVPDQVFYLPAESNVEISSYQDLYQLKAIGIERGARVSPKFDQDTKLMKYEVSTLKQLLLMLEHDRLDVFAGNEMVTDYMILEMGLHGKFKKATFRFVSGGMEYLAISRNSPHAKRLSEISRIVTDMKISGEIQKYIEKYTKSRN